MSERPRTFSTLGPWAAAWAGAVALSTLLRWWAWSRPEALESGGIPGGWFFKPVLNVIEAFTFPGWIVGYTWGDLWKSRILWLVCLAAMIAWALWLVVLAGFLWAWRVARRRAALRASASAGVASPSRRRFLTNLGFGTVGTLATAAAAEATALEPWRLATRRYRIVNAQLPPELDGLRIVQISDTHFGPRMPAEFIASVVQEALALKPDVIALTGDYILAGPRYIAGAVELFRPLVHEGGPAVVGVLGNHDWYGDGPGVTNALTALGVMMIDNGRVFFDAATRKLTVGCPASGVCFAGLGDLYCDKIDAKSALGGVPENMVRIVLAHNPDTAEHPQVRNLVGGRVDLMLSGHTHGGQIWLPFIGAPIHPSRYGQKYVGGLAQGPVCPVIISRGVGMQILPIRIGVPPELVEITLSRTP